jgi:integrase
MLFSFARVSAVIGMKVSDFYENGRRRWFRLLEKGGKHHEVPAITRPRITWPSIWRKSLLSQTSRCFKLSKRKPTGRAMSRSEAYRMIRRRALAAGIFAPVCCHSFRATGITVYLETAQKIAAHESPRTTKLYDRTDDQLTLDDL